MFELDHVFICTTESTADHLVRFGLTEGAPNTHPGQGTACRRFFLRNAMLELLWVHDITEAGSDTIRPTGLLDRWRERSSGASPFGICLRPVQSSYQTIPFSAWEYRPPYLPEPLAIHVADNASVLVEPMLFFLAFARRPDTTPVTQPLAHQAGFQEITRLQVKSPDRGPASPEVAAIERLGLATFVPGDEHCLEIEFDGGIQGNKMDFRPQLPVIFLW